MNRAIGVFDSGVGGLTVAKAISDRLPKEKIIYFGDTARVPYGPKSPEIVTRYSLEIAKMLIDDDVKAIVIACNTASAHALEVLQSKFSIPIIGVINPGAKAAVAATRNGKIAVLGTKGTIHSKAYEKSIAKLMPSAQIFPVACPLFVPLVEEGMMDHQATDLLIHHYLEELIKQPVDTLLLGCTHYPLLCDRIASYVGGRVTLVDSAQTCAAAVEEVLTEKCLLSQAANDPIHRYLVSDLSAQFNEMAEKLFGKVVSVELRGHSS